jgi:hypothetical protein
MCKEKDITKRRCYSLLEIEDIYEISFENEWDIRDILPNKVSVLPKNCIKVLEFYPDSVDGEYRVYLDGDIRKPFSIYCQDINTSSPTEYLNIYNSSIENSKTPTTNFIKMEKFEDGKVVSKYRYYEKYKISISKDSISIYPFQENFISGNLEENYFLGFLQNRFPVENGGFNIDLVP